MARGTAGWRRTLTRPGAVAAATVALCWPALWVGYPLLCPDSLGYLRDGPEVLQRLLRGPGAADIHFRSPLYSLVLYGLHGLATPWTVIAWSALLTAWTVWLTVRSVEGQRPVAVYLGLIAALCGLTTASWFVSIVLADILGGVLILCLYLLMFAPETLRRWEAVALGAVAAWCVTAHLTHLMIAAALCVLLGVLYVLRWEQMRGRGGPLLRAGGGVLLAVLAMVAVNARMFGRRAPLLTGPQPPFLMARILADGVSHDMLREQCPSLGWTICDDVDRLPWSSDEFLWSAGGIYASATPEQQTALKREEMPLVLHTLRAFPKRQIVRSWRNFAAQLTDAGIQDATYDGPWMAAHLEAALPGTLEHYQAASARENAMPLGLLHGVQRVTTVLSAATVMMLLPLLWRRRGNALAVRLLGLAMMVVIDLLANAAFTGVLSGVYPRYQGRVEWLLPLLAGLLVVGSVQLRRQDAA